MLDLASKALERVCSFPSGFSSTSLRHTQQSSPLLLPILRYPAGLSPPPIDHKEGRRAVLTMKGSY